MSSFFTNKLDKKLSLHYNKKMKTAEYIAFTIDRLPKGYVFTYADLLQR
jgi:hypothetical protein